MQENERAHLPYSFVPSFAACPIHSREWLKEVERRLSQTHRLREGGESQARENERRTAYVDVSEPYGGGCITLRLASLQHNKCTWAVNNAPCLRLVSPVRFA